MFDIDEKKKLDISSLGQTLTTLLNYEYCYVGIFQYNYVWQKNIGDLNSNYDRSMYKLTFVTCISFCKV